MSNDPRDLILELLRDNGPQTSAILSRRLRSAGVSLSSQRVAAMLRRMREQSPPLVKRDDAVTAGTWNITPDGIRSLNGAPTPTIEVSGERLVARQLLTDLRDEKVAQSLSEPDETKALEPWRQARALSSVL